MYKLYYKIIISSVFCLIMQNIVMAEIKFNANYYSDKNIYRNEYKIDINQTFFDDKIDMGGYIKQSIINKNRFEKYLNKNNDMFNLSRKFSTDADKNYFYKMYLKLKVISFNYKNFNNINNSIFFNILYYNNIKYYKLLELTFINDIYERYGIGLNYSLNSGIFTNNFYINFTKTKNNIKDILNIGFDAKQILNNSLILILNYDYSKDFNKKDNKQHFLIYNNIVINYYYDIIMNESHSFNLSSIVILDEYLNFAIGFSYKINKNYYNSFGINFNIEF